MAHENTCSCTNCFKSVVAQGLCDMHYRRLRRHGSTDQTRPSDWGKREKHPLYHTWQWIHKMEGRHTIQTNWKDFWEFVSAIGEKPSDKHRLYKIKPELGYIEGNLVWKEIIGNSKDKAQYAREWRKANPDKVKNSDLKKLFGITLDDYNSLLQKQGYCCAICGKHEKDEPTNLAVDHCHTTGEVRGLLCADCNRALGMFKDNKQVLQKAILYLKD